MRVWPSGETMISMILLMRRPPENLGKDANHTRGTLGTLALATNRQLHEGQLALKLQPGIHQLTA